MRIGTGFVMVLAGLLAGAGMQAALAANSVEAVCRLKTVKITVLPFGPNTAASHMNAGGPAFLLEGALQREAGLESVPLRQKERIMWQVSALLIKGDIENGAYQESGAAYAALRKKVSKRIRVLPGVDYVIAGRLDLEGDTWRVFLRVLPRSDPDTTVFSVDLTAQDADALNAAMENAAAEIGDFFREDRAVACMADIQSLFMGMQLNLMETVAAARRLVERYPNVVELQAYLLRFLMEDEAAYAKQIGDQAQMIVNAIRPRDESLLRVLNELVINPFEILCALKARQKDWAGVLETSRLGMEKFPLHAGVYDKWRLQAQAQMQSPAAAQIKD